MATFEGETDAPRRVKLTFDVEVLRQCLIEHDLIAPDATLHSVTPFSRGQSNPTFLLRTRAPTAVADVCFVMRKKPDGRLLASAHQVEREFRVMRALASVNFPGPFATPCTHATLAHTSQCHTVTFCAQMRRVSARRFT